MTVVDVREVWADFWGLKLLWGMLGAVCACRQCAVSGEAHCPPAPSAVKHLIMHQSGPSLLVRLRASVSL